MKSLKLILTILVAIIALIGIVLYVMILSGSSDGNGMIVAGEFLVPVTAAIALFFGIKNLATNPQSLKKSLISLAVFAIIGILSYVSASDTLTTVGDITIEASKSKLVGTGIYMFYFLAAIAILTMVGFGIKKTLKK
jgi:type III secretory pathway component EscU